ncbi:hypothetical protein [uncultured Friedmanniella sp.]|uniref:hypothetical protein n=1 Tax=uncultured Friedmanniella sp. TaxID=335381 RepID=UPI0035CAF71F
MAELQIWGDGVVGTVIGAAVWNVRTVLACDWAGGRVLAFAVEDGSLTPWGDGYHEPEGIAVDGDTAFITERTGALLRQDLLAPGRAGAVEVASGLGAPHQLVLPGDGTAVVADRAGGRLVRVDLASGAVDVVVAGLGQPVGLAVGADGALFVAEQAGGVISRIDPDGTRTVLTSGLVGPFFLGWADPDRTQLLTTERAPAHRVGVLDLSAPLPVVQRLLGRSITQPSAAIMVGGRLVVSGQDRLVSLDASAGLRPGVDVGVPSGPIWPGGWSDVPINTGVSGYTRAELAITVEPAGVATISEHPGDGFDPVRPTVRLLAGGGLGAAEVVVRDAGPGSAELGRAPISVGFDETSPVDGPPLWVGDRTSTPLLHTLALVRGVDDAGTLLPRDAAGAVLPRWRVLAVLVDTGDATWPTTLSPTSLAPTIADAKSTWATVLTGAGSVDAFYREQSGGRLGLQLVGGSVQGPVSLGQTWSDWFTMSNGQWLAKDDVMNRVVGALQGTGIDWQQVDAVFMIVRSAGGGQIVWPRANGKAGPYKVKTLGGGDADVLLGKVAMPHDQTTAPSLGFTNVEVSSHELGHTLGLNDIYMNGPGFTDAMKARDLKTHELMANEAGLPHLSARHKLLLGFLDPAHVKAFSYDFDDDQTFDLAPLSAGLPSAGRFAAVELKVSPKISWFFEFRAPVPGVLGDQAAFASGQVMGYDAWNYKAPPVVGNARTPIILLNDDGDGEGPLIVAAQDYDVLNTENQNDISEFRLEVLAIVGGVAKVRVVVRPVAQPDPAIRNNNGEAGDWKSPDIEIQNEVSDVDPAFLNRPIVNIVNRVVATVTNVGGLPAPNVSVKISVKPFNTDDPDSEGWELLAPKITHDIAAGGTATFAADWTPPADRHYCIQARIDRYTSIPGAAADEPDVDNNLAQSNYFEVASKPSSPATREISIVDVHNPYDHPVSAAVEVQQDSNIYRTYVDHRWLHLEPGQTRSVRMEVESTATSIWDAIERHLPAGRSWLRTWLDHPELGDTPRSGSGVTMAASTAVATAVRLLERDARNVLVQVTSPAGGPPPSTGSVAVQARFDDDSTEVVSAPVEANGLARLAFEPGRGGDAVLRYSGSPGYAPSPATEVRLPDPPQ